MPSPKPTSKAPAKAEPVTATLLISCRDQRGIVAEVSNYIYRNSGNIVHADQHSDEEQGLFLQRIEWELNGFGVPREGIAASFEPLAEKFGMSWRLRFSDMRPRVALLVSNQGHCLYDLIARAQMGEYKADFPLVISNHPTFKAAAENFGAEFHCLPVTPGTKAKQEEQIIRLIESKKIDLVVLARYMQILSRGFVERYPERIINIHHSFLPAFVGAKPYQQAHERGVKLIGATAHYATADLDQGPIIEQEVARVTHRDTVSDLVRKGRDLEKVTLARAVSLHLRNRVLVYGNKTVVFD